MSNAWFTPRHKHKRVHTCSINKHKRSDIRKRSYPRKSSLENGTSNVSKITHEEEILLLLVLLLLLRRRRRWRRENRLKRSCWERDICRNRKEQEDSGTATSGRRILFLAICRKDNDNCEPLQQVYGKKKDLRTPS